MFNKQVKVNYLKGDYIEYQFEERNENWINDSLKEYSWKACWFEDKVDQRLDRFPKENRFIIKMKKSLTKRREEFINFLYLINLKFQNIYRPLY